MPVAGWSERNEIGKQAPRQATPVVERPLLEGGL